LAAVVAMVDPDRRFPSLVSHLGMAVVRTSFGKYRNELGWMNVARL
jgi:hypothetical protein